MKARRQIVDPLTGAQVKPTSPVAVDTGNVVVGRDVVVSDNDRDPTRDRFGITPEAEPALREAVAESRRQQKARAPKGRGPAIKLTMTSPEAGVREFEQLNPAMFADEAAFDMKDKTRDFLDGVEIRSGKRHIRANRSKQGKEILQKQGSGIVRATLSFLFGMARSRRWRDVPWNSVTQYIELVNQERIDEGVGPAPVVFPIAAGLDTPAERLARIREEVGPEAAARAIRAMNAEELRALADRMEKAIGNSGEECMTGEAVRAAKERVRTIRRWAKDPSKIPEWSCVGTYESEGSVCSFPAILEDIQRIENACQIDYDPQWPLERAEQACENNEFADRVGIVGEPCKVAGTSSSKLTETKKRFVRVGSRTFWV